MMGLALAGVGCSGSSFLGAGYTNFTAYYNTFYNANKAFDEGMKSVASGDAPIDRRHYISIFQQPGQGSNKSFKKAIDKSASLLREHPDSKWVDDALILIGKSYYFQQNFVGAEQKFREVIDAETELEGKARFWLARTLAAADRFDEAAQAITAGLGEQQDFGTWTDRLQLVRGQIAVRQGRWEGAETALAQGLDGSVPDEAAARAAFLLGQVRETLGQYDAAATAYDRVSEYGPRYELAYAAQFNVVRTMGLRGDTDAALDRLRGMERDGKNYDRRFELALLRGRLHRIQGKPEEARKTLRGLLYRGDSREQGPSGTVEGRVHHALGVLYRDALNDFENAAAHFDTASTSLGRPSGGQQAQQEERRQTPFAITNSSDLADRYGTIAERAQAVARMDSLLRLGTMPREEFETFIADLEAKRAKEQAARDRARRDRERAQQFASRGASAGRNRQSSRTTTTSVGSESSFLYHEDPVRVQETKRSFQQTWGDRPRVDNWRRIEAVSGSRGARDTAQQPAQGAGQPPGDAAEGRSAQAAVQIDVSAVPRDSAAQAAMRDERAVARYEFGSALFLSANRPDSAAVWFQRVIEENGDHPIARRALYALAEVRTAQGEMERGQELYRRLLETYPNSEFADRAVQQLQLGTQRQAQSDDAVADSLYDRAYATWQEGALRSALASMGEVVTQYPKTPAAPRAALATGVLYHHLMRTDTTDAPRRHLDTVLAALSPTDTTQADTTQADTTPSVADTTGADSLQTGTARADSLQPDAARADVPSRSDRDTLQANRARTDTTVARQTRPDTPPTEGALSDTAQTTPARAERSSDPSPADSLVSDSATAPAASRARDATRDTTDAPLPDSTRNSAPTSSRTAASDTTQTGTTASVDTSAVAAPSSAGDAAVPSPLVTFLERLAERYPDTPQAKRAQEMVAALTETPADTAAAPADSVRADSLQATPDSMQMPTGSTAAPGADSTTSATTPSDTAAVNPTRPDTTVRDPVRPDTLQRDTTASDSVATPGGIPRPVPQRAPRDSTEVDSTQGGSDTSIPPPPGRGRTPPDTSTTPPSGGT